MPKFFLQFLTHSAFGDGVICVLRCSFDVQPVTLQQVYFRRFYYSDKLSGCSVLIILVISVGGIQHW